MRYKLTICYDGSDFYGFQRQRGLISVQECLEEALSTKLNDSTIRFFNIDDTFYIFWC